MKKPLSIHPEHQRGASSTLRARRIVCAFGRTWLGAALLSLLLLPGPAHSSSSRLDGAGGDPKVGRVLRLDGPEAYVDLGRRDGARAGEQLILYRLVSALDPDSGRTLTDRFRLSEVEVIEAGEVLSLVRVPPSIAPMVSLGDEVRLTPLAMAEQRETSEEVAPSAQPAPEPVPADVQELAQAFSRSAGASFEQRLEAWRDFAEAHPDSDLLPYVAREIAALESALAPEAKRRSRQATPPMPDLAVSAPREVRGGEEVRIVVSSRGETLPGSVLLHFRRPEHQAFRLRQMTSFGDGAYAAEIPRSMIEEPWVEWYVSATSGSEEIRIGSGVDRVFVEAPPEPPSPAGRSEVSLAFQYVDFYRFKGLDAYSQFEADFLYRVLYPSRRHGQGPQLYSLRIGFGAFNGVGGEIERVLEAERRDDRAGLRGVGFNFGYTELEFRLSRSLAMMFRGIAGIGDAGLESGLQGRVRVGPEAGTNLVLGALSVGEIGRSWNLQLAWDSVPKVPMSASVEVTTWPVSGSDLGVRLLYEARYRFTPWLEVGGRVGYGLRNINHGGMTLGLGTVFSW